jgi:hypothetical protein
MPIFWNPSLPDDVIDYWSQPLVQNLHDFLMRFLTTS